MARLNNKNQKKKLGYLAIKESENYKTEK